MNFSTTERLQKLEQVELLNRRYSDYAPADLLKAVFEKEFPHQTAIISSFGAESAVLLHMAASVDTSIPVIFLETFKHFPETLTYRDTIMRHLGLNQLIITYPKAGHLKADDPMDKLYMTNTDLCCHIRKTMPMIQSLRSFACYVTGRKKFQTDDRKDMQLFELQNNWIRFNPILNLSKSDLDNYITANDLPLHPLVKKGYNSIGCAVCTVKSKNYREGRWKNNEKTECGIHNNPDKKKF